MKTIFKIFLLFISVSVFSQRQDVDFNKVNVRTDIKSPKYYVGSDTLLTSVKIRADISDTADVLRTSINARWDSTKVKQAISDSIATISGGVTPAYAGLYGVFVYTFNDNDRHTMTGLELITNDGKSGYRGKIKNFTCTDSSMTAQLTGVYYVQLSCYVFTDFTEVFPQVINVQFTINDTTFANTYDAVTIQPSESGEYYFKVSATIYIKQNEKLKASISTGNGDGEQLTVNNIRFFATRIDE